MIFQYFFDERLLTKSNNYNIIYNISYLYIESKGLIIVERFNGHIVLDDVPAAKLSMSNGGRAEDERCGPGVVIHLDCPKLGAGVADIHVHTSCCQHKSGEGTNALYRIVLLDEQYNLYFDGIDPKTNEPVRCVAKSKLSSELIYNAMEKTKANYARIREKRRLAQKELVPKDMLTERYLVPSPDHMFNAFTEYHK